MMRFFYSPEMLDFLRKGYARMECADLTVSFNARFATQKTTTEIRSTLKNHKISSGRKGRMPGAHLSFTSKQINWLKKEYQQLTLLELPAAFLARFGEVKTQAQIRAFLHNHSIKSGRSGKFTKNNKPWNKGMKGLSIGGVATYYKKGHIPANRRPLFAERISSKDGFILIKVPETDPHTGFPTRFKAKHVWIWEQAHGPVADGMVVSFKDGNKLNCELSNLELMSRAEMCMLNAVHAPKNVPDDMRETARLIAKAKARSGKAHQRMADA